VTVTKIIVCLLCREVIYVFKGEQEPDRCPRCGELFEEALAKIKDRRGEVR